MTPTELFESDARLDGLLDAEDASPDDLGRLVRLARGPADVTEFAGRDRAVAALADASVVTVLTPARRRRTGRRLVAAKVIAVAAVASAGVAAAAATGVIEVGPRHSGSAIATSSVGTGDQPSVHGGSSGLHRGKSSSTTAIDGTGSTASDSTARESGAVGPDLDGPARHGLCTAFGARDGVPGRSVAASNLAEAAAAAGQSVAEFCEDASTTTTPGSSTTAKAGGNANGAPNGNANGTDTTKTTGPPPIANPGAANANGSAATKTTGPPANAATGLNPADAGAANGRAETPTGRGNRPADLPGA